MSNVWDRFNGIANKDEVASAKEAFKPIEAGKYETMLELLEPSESEKHIPMLKSRFRMKSNNRIVFYNLMLQNISKPEMTAVNIAEAVNFINSLTGEDYSFTNLGEFAQYISTLMVVGREYTIQISYGAKDVDQKFPKVKVLPTIPEDSAMPFDA